MDSPKTSPAMLRVLNKMRQEASLPRVQVADKPGQVTREMVWNIAVEAWKKYPQALTNPDYEMGELTLSLVDKEILQRVDDLRRGVKIKKAALKDYFN